MKVAELFADIGFKVTGEEELKSFETSLQNIAQAARNAAIALKDLASARIPRAPAGRVPASTAAGSTQQTTSVGQWWSAFQTRQKLATSLMVPQPPVLTPPSAPAGNTAVLQGLKNLGMLALKIGGVTTIALALKKLVSAMIDMVNATRLAAVGMEKFTGQTGISRATLRSWELAASKVGVSADEVQSAFKNVLQKQQAIRWTGEGSTPFLQLGIDALATPREVFQQFQERTKNMTQAQAVYWGSLIGFSEDWVYFLRQQKGKIDDLDNEVLSGEQQATVLQLNAAWKELTFNLGLLRDKLVADVAPAITWALQRIAEAEKLLVVSKPLREAIFTPSMFAYKAATGGYHTTNVENKVQVDVSGAGQPRETARATATAIQRELSNSYFSRTPPSAFGPPVTALQ